jgi:hypothetical protein
MLAITAVHAGADPLPDGATILDKYVEVTGGRAAHERLYNRVSKVRVIHPEMGFEDTMVVYRAEPNHEFLEIESDALGSIKQGVYGNIAWVWNLQTEPMVEEGEALAAALDRAAFDLIVNWRKYYKEVKCVGEETVGGKACYKVVLAPNHGEPETRYYDKASNLMVRAKITRLFTNMPSMPVEMTLSDYRAVDGVLLPHRIEQQFEQCGSTRERVLVTTTIEHNVELPPDRFLPPKSVLAKALALQTSSALKTAFSGAEAKGSEPARPPCGAKKSTAGTGAAGGKRSPCGGG